MPLIHVVLFRLKDGIGAQDVLKFKDLITGMAGKIPGLVEINANPPFLKTAARAKGYNMGLVATLEKAEDLQVYATHPAHLEVIALKDQICEDALAYDMEI
ncbi:hypothetical protein KEM56_005514 [Ascosphaera pollenicola]|nr:hypothetical protein KEM56_005514 [Ascosphaera pollenicola]